MKEIQAWLGHSTYNTTADIYAHLDTSSVCNTGKAISNVFETKKEVVTVENYYSLKSGLNENRTRVFELKIINYNFLDIFLDVSKNLYFLVQIIVWWLQVESNH